MTNETVMKELQERFSDLINYQAEDPLTPIDPLNYRTPENDSCLHLAAMRGDHRAVELLLEAGLDVNQRGDMDNTALHYAKKFGHSDVVDLLIKHGASEDLKNQFGETAKDVRLAKTSK